MFSFKRTRIGLVIQATMSHESQFYLFAQCVAIDLLCLQWDSLYIFFSNLASTLIISEILILKGRNSKIKVKYIYIYFGR